MIRFIDVHCHLQEKQFDSDREKIISQMKEEGIGAIVVGVDLGSSQRAVELADAHSNLYACVGVHPVDNPNEDFIASEYKSLLTHPKTVAVGECGFDFFHAEKNEKEYKRQLRLFETQIATAVAHDKPLMLHVRDGHEEALGVLKKAKQIYGEKLRGNVHFFTAGLFVAEEYIRLGFYISFPGVVTFAKELMPVLQCVSSGFIHIETDSPYAAPEPKRGQKNTPLNLIYIFEYIAGVKRLSNKGFQDQLLDNAQKMFGIGK